MHKAIIASLFLGFSAAATVQASDNSAQLGGFIAPQCSITGVDVQLDFASVAVGSTVTDNSITIRCNDVDGANLEMRSSEGGLEHDDDEDFEVEYTATLTSSVIGGGSLVLETGPAQGNNDVNVQTQLSASPDLADGRNAELEVELNTGGTYAGGYSDTLQITIEANI